MTNKIYSIGIDPGIYGAIAFVDQYIGNSKVIPMPKARPWLCPYPDDHKDAFYKVNCKGGKKGDRQFKTHDKWGCNIIFHDDVIDSICDLDLSLSRVQSYIEDPEAQGVGRAGLDNSKTVGMNVYPLLYATEAVTEKIPWSVTTQKWQSHPAIATYGQVDWTLGAKDKKKAKKHNAVATANKIFGMNIPPDQDGLADALLIGLYGALKYPPVVSVNAVEAWLILQSKWGFPSLPMDTNLPFAEALVYARRLNEEEYSTMKDVIYDRLNIKVPPIEELPQEGIVGYVILGGYVDGIKKFGRGNEQYVVNKEIFPAIAFDMEGKSIKPYYHKLPHLIQERTSK